MTNDWFKPEIIALVPGPCSDVRKLFEHSFVVFNHFRRGQSCTCTLEVCSWVQAWWQLDVMNLNAGVMFNGSGQASPVGDPNSRPNVPLRYSAPGFIYQGPPELTYTTPSSRAPPSSPGYAISPHKPASTIEFSTSPTRNHPRHTTDPENSPRPVVQQPPESLSRVSMFDRTSVEDLPCIVPVQLPVQPPPPNSQPLPGKKVCSLISTIRSRAKLDKNTIHKCRNPFVREFHLWTRFHLKLVRPEERYQSVQKRCRTWRWSGCWTDSLL